MAKIISTDEFLSGGQTRQPQKQVISTEQFMGVAPAPAPVQTVQAPPAAPQAPMAAPKINPNPAFQQVGRKPMVFTDEQDNADLALWLDPETDSLTPDQKLIQQDFYKKGGQTDDSLRKRDAISYAAAQYYKAFPKNVPQVEKFFTEKYPQQWNEETRKLALQKMQEIEGKEFFNEAMKKEIMAGFEGGNAVESALGKNPITRSIGTGVLQAVGDVASTVSRPFSDKYANELNRVTGYLETGAAELDKSSWMPEAIGTTIRGGTRSLTTAAMLAPAGQMGMAAGFGAIRGNQALTEAEDAGIDGTDKWTYAGRAAIIEGGISAAFNKLGIGGIEKMLGGKSQIAKSGLKNLFKGTGIAVLQELPEEITTEILDNVNQELSLVEPGAASTENQLKTILQTTLQVAFTVGLGGAVTGSMNQKSMKADEDWQKAISEQNDIPLERVNKIVEDLRSKDLGKKAYDYELGRKLAIEMLKTDKGVQNWVALNGEEARILADTENPTAEDFDILGLPPTSEKQRQEIAEKVRNAIYIPVTPEMKQAAAEFDATTPQNQQAGEAAPEAVQPETIKPEAAQQAIEQNKAASVINDIAPDVQAASTAQETPEQKLKAADDLETLADRPGMNQQFSEQMKTEAAALREEATQITPIQENQNADIQKEVQTPQVVDNLRAKKDNTNMNISLDENNKIYRDSMGTPEPNASISHFGGSYGKGGYFSIQSIANISAPKFDNFEDAIQWAEDNGFTIDKIGKDGYGTPFADISHVETKKQKLELEDNKKKELEGAKDVFVRYGNIPKSGKSKNYRDNLEEEGVSVFRGKLTKNGEVYITPKTNYELGTFMFMNDRPIYIIDGKEIGVGSDGEPILINATQMTKKQAIKKYFPSMQAPQAEEVGQENLTDKSIPQELGLQNDKNQQNLQTGGKNEAKIAQKIEKEAGPSQVVQEVPPVESVSAEKQPWEMTRKDFNDAFLFSGVVDASLESKYATDLPNMAAKFSTDIRSIPLDRAGQPGDGIVRIYSREGVKFSTTNEYILPDNASSVEEITASEARENAHKAIIRKAITNGKPVPLNVLQEYAGEKWADDAIKNLQSNAKSDNVTPNVTPIKTGQTRQNFIDQAVQAGRSQKEAENNALIADAILQARVVDTGKAKNLDEAWQKHGLQVQGIGRKPRTQEQIVEDLKRKADKVAIDAAKKIDAIPDLNEYWKSKFESIVGEQYSVEPTFSFAGEIPTEIKEALQDKPHLRMKLKRNQSGAMGEDFVAQVGTDTFIQYLEDMSAPKKAQKRFVDEFLKDLKKTPENAPVFFSDAEIKQINEAYDIKLLTSSEVKTTSEISPVLNQTDLFGKEIIKPISGETKSLGLDTGEVRKTADTDIDVTPDLLREANTYFLKNKGKITDNYVKSFVLDMQSKFKEGTADLYNDYQKPMTEARAALERSELGGSLFSQSDKQQEQDDSELLFQNSKGAYNPAERLAQIAKSADASTLPHEMLHWAVDLESRLNPDSEAMKALEDEYGKPYDKWGREEQETLARQWERFLRTGESPVAKLQKVFEYFKDMLEKIYKNIKGSSIDIEISPAAQNFFETILGGKEETTTEEKYPLQEGVAARKQTVDAIRSELKLDEISSPDRVKWEESRQKAWAEGIPDRAVGIATQYLLNPNSNSLNSTHVAGMTDKVAELYADVKRLEKKIAGSQDEAQNKTDFVEMERIRKDIDYITTALVNSGTEPARALAIRRMMLKDDMTIMPVLNRARRTKKSNLTSEEKAKLEKAVDALAAKEKENAELKGRLNEIEARQVLHVESNRRYEKMTAEQKQAEYDQLAAKTKELLAKGCPT